MPIIDYSDPGTVEAIQLEQRRRAAEAQYAKAVQGDVPAFSGRAALARALTGILGAVDMGNAEKRQRELAKSKQDESRGEMDKLMDFLDQKPPTVGAGLPQVDDEGNQMPGNVQDAAEKRKQLARTLVGSSNPQVAGIALQTILAKPKEEEAFTLKPGESRYKGNKVVAALPDKPEVARKVGDSRRIIQGGEEIQQEWDGSKWSELGRGARWQPQQPDRTLIEVQDPKNPQATILVPREQATGKAGAQSVTGARSTREDTDNLRKEFDALPEVKNYKAVMPIVQSAAKAPNTPAGDIDLIYAVGKVMDPGSVVREGELNLVIAAGSPAQKLQGMVSYVKGGGRLAPEQRAQLMETLGTRTGAMKDQYGAARSKYEDIAKQRGYDFGQVFTDLPGSGGGSRTVVRTGMLNGRKVNQYSDGTTDYAN